MVSFGRKWALCQVLKKERFVVSFEKLGIVMSLEIVGFCGEFYKLTCNINRL